MRRATRGFTMLELMIVLIIIGILGAVVGLNLVGAAERAKRDATAQSMRTIQQGLKMYHARYSAYPPTAMGLDALTVENIIDAKIQDGWNRPMDYYAPGPSGELYIIVSYGADGQPGGDEDIYRTDRDTD